MKTNHRRQRRGPPCVRIPRGWRTAIVRCSGDGIGQTTALVIASTMAVLFPGMPAGNTLAQDRITVRDERSGKMTDFEAVVMEWDYKRLLYFSNGRENTLPATRIAGVEYARTEKQREADQYFQQGNFSQAWQSYENAMLDETRPWVQREMVARQLRSAAALGHQMEALQAFFRIQKETPESRFFHLIPVAWHRAPPDGGMVALYQDWMSGTDETQALIAASWLLNSDQVASANRLRELAQSRDSRIAHLAQAQLWRTRTIDAKPAELQRWLVAVDRMPENLQAGPRYQIALVKKRFAATVHPGKKDEAIVTLLQIPILFPEQYQLCGAALIQAHQMLVADGRNNEAANVLSELKRDFGFSRSALELESRIENLDQ